jgi:hypothetical protein
MTDLLTILGEPEYPKPDFPKEGFQFEAWCSKLPDCDDPPFVVYDLLPRTLMEAKSYDLMIGSLDYLDPDTWVDSELVSEPGLWQLDCQVYYDTSYDWESGHKETTLYINILKATKI